jgi:hypothetical protein
MKNINRSCRPWPTANRNGPPRRGHAPGRLRPQLVADAVVADYIHEISQGNRPSEREGWMKVELAPAA